jgi:hypothetical protein
MYQLYTDKQENFECTLKIEGASLNNSLCRLIVESKDVNLLFEGKISSTGEVEIPIKKLKNHLTEGDTGKLKLEVIAEDTYFTPWEDTFEIKTSKKVTVEMKEPATDKKIIEVVSLNKKEPITESPKKEQPKPIPTKTKTVKSSKDLIKEYLKLLVVNGINKNNLESNRPKIAQLTESFIKTNKEITFKDINEIVKKSMSIIEK